MWTTLILAAIVGAGAFLLVQGLLLLQGRGQATVWFIERPFIEALAVDDPKVINRVLGRLRLVYGFFLIVVALWGLLS